MTYDNALQTTLVLRTRTPNIVPISNVCPTIQSFQSQLLVSQRVPNHGIRHGYDVLQKSSGKGARLREYSTCPDCGSCSELKYLPRTDFPWYIILPTPGRVTYVLAAACTVRQDAKWRFTAVSTPILVCLQVVIPHSEPCTPL